VLNSNCINVEIKTNLYAAAVGSLFTYGCEGWTMTPATMRRLNGANSRLLTHFTGKTIVEEARANTTSYDLVLNIRKRRLCWLVHILRVGKDRLIRKAVVAQYKMQGQGNMFMDTPSYHSLDMLVALAVDNDKKTWRKLVKDLK
jgi:hypothetical protein